MLVVSRVFASNKIQYEQSSNLISIVNVLFLSQAGRVKVNRLWEEWRKWLLIILSKRISGYIYIPKGMGKLVLPCSWFDLAFDICINVFQNENDKPKCLFAFSALVQTNMIKMITGSCCDLLYIVNISWNYFKAQFYAKLSHCFWLLGEILQWLLLCGEYQQGSLLM